MSNFENSELTSSVLLTLRAQTAVNAKLNLRDNVKEVLSLGAQCSVTSYQSGEGEAQYQGRCAIKVIYLTEDGKLSTGAFTTEFTDKIASAQITPATQLDFKVICLDKNYELTGNTLSVRLLLEIAACYARVAKQNVFSGGEGVYTQSKEIELCDAIVSENREFTLQYEATLKNKADTMLLAESNVCIKDYSVSDEVLSVNGVAYITMTYLAADNLYTETQSFDFTEELEAVNLNEAQISLCALTKNTKIRLEMDENSETDGAYAEIQVALSLTGYKVINATVVTDAYSESEELTLNYGDLETTLPCGYLTKTVTTEQTLSAAYSGSCSVVFKNVVITDVKTQAETVRVEGVLSGAVLLEQDGFSAVAFELPFAESVEVDFVHDNCVSCVCGNPVEIRAVANGKITITADICLEITAYANEKHKVVFSAEATPLNTENDSAIEIFLAKKGESLWQLAKSLHKSEDEILSLNPDLVSPLQRDTRIVLYHKLS